MRTFVQAALGAIIGEGGISLTEADFHLWRPVLIAGITAVITFLQNLLEEKVPKIDLRGDCIR